MMCKFEIDFKKSFFVAVLSKDDIISQRTGLKTGVSTLGFKAVIHDIILASFNGIED